MISVLIQTESHFPTNRRLIRDAVIEALKHKMTHNTEVSISIIGDRLMRRLNRQFRHTDSTTNVLSFPLNETSSGQPFIDPPDGILRLGDILVSYPQAIADAAQQNKMVDEVICQLVLHGLDHLLGIHHPE